MDRETTPGRLAGPVVFALQHFVFSFMDKLSKPVKLLQKCIIRQQISKSFRFSSDDSKMDSEFS
jgi:hypothetical protein